MKKSFIDRIFPRPPGTLLPQYEQSEPLARRLSASPTSPPRISLREDTPSSAPDSIAWSSPSRPRSNASTGHNRKLSSAPLSASVLHYDDPFLPVERAARTLQTTIQSLLDAQSSALSGRVNGIELDDIASAGSVTPTQSAITPRSSSSMQAIPVRQPLKKKVTLRGARKGLSKKMQEFAGLRREELHILDTEIRTRTSALKRVEDLETKKQTCTTKIESIRQENMTAAAEHLRSEANNVSSEIAELEHRLLELRVRHRHLLDQADQLESSLESKISSFNGTISMIDKEAREFLRRPPVSFALADTADSKHLGMYALKPERRTLAMAKDQWTSELEVLTDRKIEVEIEQTALVEGQRVWLEAILRIHEFEQKLRGQTATLTDQSGDNLDMSMNTVLKDLDAVIESLESDLSLAESKNWNLIICAIGAELEAFQQARDLLQQTQNATLPDHKHFVKGLDGAEPRNTAYKSDSERGFGRLESAGSNESLRDTLQEFSKTASVSRVGPSGNSFRSESEDDEPPVDFLLSR